MKLLVSLGMLLFSTLALADILQFKDTEGRIYQVDSNIRVEGSEAVSRVRWPDNMVTTVRVGGCGSSTGSIAFSSEKSGKVLQKAQWSRSGTGMPDRIANLVCRAK